MSRSSATQWWRSENHYFCNLPPSVSLSQSATPLWLKDKLSTLCSMPSTQRYTYFSKVKLGLVTPTKILLGSMYIIHFSRKTWIRFFRKAQNLFFVNLHNAISLTWVVGNHEMPLASYRTVIVMLKRNAIWRRRLAVTVSEYPPKCLIFVKLWAKFF